MLHALLFLACGGSPPPDAPPPDVVPGAPTTNLQCAEGTTQKETTTASGTERWCDRDGVMHGPYLRLFPDGTRAARGAYDNSQPDGDWVWWHENGQESGKGKYAKGGRQTGSWTRWHPNGAKQEEGDYLAGRKAGSWIRWFESGKKAEEGLYHNDTKNGLWTYFLDDDENRVEKTELWEGGVMKEEKVVNAKPVEGEEGKDGKGEKGAKSKGDKPK
jgi:antitoxin component YwqK of YwqJK toxin-antitoxin module